MTSLSDAARIRQLEDRVLALETVGGEAGELRVQVADLQAQLGELREALMPAGKPGTAFKRWQDAQKGPGSDAA